ncbi:hypothetical protein T492DRAFT_937462 [Pavlovales sp. CCMP2436]|nr:hypothetical protein T492DRAFT_937462 [Pavlovales sp. CCMP2436]
MGARCSSGTRGKRRTLVGPAELRSHETQPSSLVVPLSFPSVNGASLPKPPRKGIAASWADCLGVERCAGGLGGRSYPGIHMRALLRLRALAVRLQRSEGPMRDHLTPPSARAPGEPLSTDDVLREIVLEATAARHCAYHELLPREETGAASVHVCHPRAGLFVDLVDALAAAELAPGALYSIDVFTVSPWRGRLDDLAKRSREVGPRARACVVFVLVLSRQVEAEPAGLAATLLGRQWSSSAAVSSPWAALRDLWCLFELRAASLRSTEIRVCVPRAQRAGLHSSVMRDLDGLHAQLTNLRGAGAAAQAGGHALGGGLANALAKHASIAEIEERCVLVLTTWLAAAGWVMVEDSRGDEGLLRALGRLQRARGELDEEETVLRRLVRLTEERLGESDSETLGVVLELGRLLASFGQFEPATHHYRRCVCVRVTLARGRLDEAELLFTHAELGYAHASGFRGGRSQRMMATLHGQGCLLQRRGLLMEASVLEEMGDLAGSDVLFRLYIREDGVGHHGMFRREASVASSLNAALVEEFEIERRILEDQTEINSHRKQRRFSKQLEVRRNALPKFAQGQQRWTTPALAAGQGWPRSASWTVLPRRAMSQPRD